MTNPETELNRERIENLMASILTPIRDNYQRGPVSRDRCFEALNALAAAAALVIEGSDGPGGEARAFFEKAILQHVGPAVHDSEPIELAMALRCCAKAIDRLEASGLKRDAAQIRDELAAIGQYKD
jgi:hypothetical protein